MTIDHEAREQKAYKRDYVIHKFFLVFTTVAVLIFGYLLFEILGPKPQNDPYKADDLESPVFFIPTDNTKELKLENE